MPYLDRTAILEQCSDRVPFVPPPLQRNLVPQESSLPNGSAGAHCHVVPCLEIVFCQQWVSQQRVEVR
jgi:hypothetical protein